MTKTITIEDNISNKAEFELEMMAILVQKINNVEQKYTKCDSELIKRMKDAYSSHEFFFKNHIISCDDKEKIRLLNRYVQLFDQEAKIRINWINKKCIGKDIVYGCVRYVISKKLDENNDNLMLDKDMMKFIKETILENKFTLSNWEEDIQIMVRNGVSMIMVEMHSEE